LNRAMTAAESIAFPKCPEGKAVFNKEGFARFFKKREKRCAPFCVLGEER